MLATAIEAQPIAARGWANARDLMTIGDRFVATHAVRPWAAKVTVRQNAARPATLDVAYFPQSYLRLEFEALVAEMQASELRAWRPGREDVVFRIERDGVSTADLLAEALPPLWLPPLQIALTRDPRHLPLIGGMGSGMLADTVVVDFAASSPCDVIYRGRADGGSFALTVESATGRMRTWSWIPDAADSGVVFEMAYHEPPPHHETDYVVPPDRFVDDLALLPGPSSVSWPTVPSFAGALLAPLDPGDNDRWSFADAMEAAAEHQHSGDGDTRFIFLAIPLEATSDVDARAMIEAFRAGLRSARNRLASRLDVSFSLPTRLVGRVIFVAGPSDPLLGAARDLTAELPPIRRASGASGVETATPAWLWSPTRRLCAGGDTGPMPTIHIIDTARRTERSEVVPADGEAITRAIFGESESDEP
ncbi:MAG: hypothetical protein CMJ31_04285 [Phycisphaerae bacterium]|nr:hypothetical protein [Phycisphaerae bacterium]